LLAGPLGGRVAGHVEVNNPAAIMGQYQKDVQVLPFSDLGFPALNWSEGVLFGKHLLKFLAF